MTNHSRVRILAATSLILQAVVLAGGTIVVASYGAGMAEFDGRPSDSARDTFGILANFLCAAVLAGAGVSLIRWRRTLPVWTAGLVLVSLLIDVAWIIILLSGIVERESLTSAIWDLVIAGTAIATVAALLVTTLTRSEDV